MKLWFRHKVFGQKNVCTVRASDDSSVIMESIRTGRQRRVLILDISASGHHPIYLRWLLESELGESAEIIVASRKEMFEHPEIRACVVPFTKHEIEIGPEVDRRLKNFSPFGLIRMNWMIGRLYRKVCSTLVHRMSIDFVIVPFLDDCMLGLAVPREAFGGVSWMTITMRTMFHYEAMGVIAPPQRFTAMRRLLFHRVLKQKSMIAVLTIDPTLAEFAGKQHEPELRKVEFLPDPATNHSVLPSRCEARQELSIPADKRLIVLYGELSARKGVLSLVEGAADPACSRELHVLLAGRYREPDQVLMSKAFQTLTAEGRVHAIHGYLNDEQERQLLAAADCMWLGYTDFYGASGIMVLSGRHAVPVMASSAGLIGHLARKYEIGVVIDPLDRMSVVTALNRLVHEPEYFEQAGRNGVSAFQKHRPVEMQHLVTKKAQQIWQKQIQ